MADWGWERCRFGGISGYLLQQRIQSNLLGSYSVLMPRLVTSLTLTRNGGMALSSIPYLVRRKLIGSLPFFLVNMANRI
jgi:hypothetical protein